MFVLATACGSSVTDAGSPPEIVGRLERGRTVQIMVRDVTGASSIPATSVSLSPADAGLVSGNSVTFSRAGAVTITATAAGRTVSTTATVAVPPTIFFDAVDQGNRDVYSAALDGQDVKRWTLGALDDQEPSVAKGVLVYSSSRNGSFDLYALTLPGETAERRLTTSAFNETQPDVSPDGGRVVYTSDAGGLSHIWIVNADGSGVNRLTSTTFSGGATIEVNARWAPAGDKLVFMATPSGRANLFTVAPVVGATPSAVSGSTPQATDVEPAWSPDGNRVVFASTRAGSTSLFMFDVRTSAVTQLTSNASDGQPVWLPDGRVVFTRFANTVSALLWLDPDKPAEGLHTVPVPYQRPMHAAAVR